MSEIRAAVGDIEMQKSTMENKIKSLVDQFEAETGLHVKSLSLDRFRRRMGMRQPPYRVEAVVQCWPKHTMGELEHDRDVRRIKEQVEVRRGSSKGIEIE